VDVAAGIISVAVLSRGGRVAGGESSLVTMPGVIVGDGVPGSPGVGSLAAWQAIKASRLAANSAHKINEGDL
jgi:hypothetical protein